ncbi:hypothetical protein WJS89_00325 [Sphingomicrobium sp. XHP0235]|uniref:hypothetical protein n=1 Tax=Sphingomicrobium aquimarinum TaxID=3133971 RepID=UPI0031FF36C2
MNGGSARKFYEECVPMSEPEVLHGTWSTAFEFNVFYEDEVLTGEPAFRLPASWNELLIEGTRFEALWTNEAQVYEVKFIGRKPVCDVDDPVAIIFVDKVISARLLESHP